MKPNSASSELFRRRRLERLWADLSQGDIETLADLSDEQILDELAQYMTPEELQAALDNISDDER